MKQVKSYFQRLNKLQILGIGTALLIVFSGFGAAAYVNSQIGSTCTAVGCPCDKIVQTNFSENPEVENMTGERDCNTCSSSKYIFHLGVLQIYKHCTETQVYVCEAGEKTDEYYRDDGCDYEFRTVTP